MWQDATLGDDVVTFLKRRFSHSFDTSSRYSLDLQVSLQTCYFVSGARGSWCLTFDVHCFQVFAVQAAERRICNS